MDYLLDTVTQNIKNLNLTYIDDEQTLSILKIAFNSILNFINLNFDPFFDFNSIYHIISDITIGEYLLLIKNSNLQSQLDLQDSIKTISEGDISITYFESQSNEDKIDFLINYFLNKKKDLITFKSISW